MAAQDIALASPSRRSPDVGGRVAPGFNILDVRDQELLVHPGTYSCNNVAHATFIFR